MVYLANFYSIRPPFESSQQETLEWLVAAHTAAERPADEGFAQQLSQRLWHVGCKPDAIAKRGHVLEDFRHREWNRMEVYRLEEAPCGVLLRKRMVHFQEHALRAFREFYADETAPNHLIHVSCTGYLSPSAAQMLISQKQWGETTTVTHAYHMGCYGAMPALRMAKGFAESARVDIVHTEICSLHSNPSLHRTDQLVSQSLFADGFIKYSIDSQNSAKSLKLMAIREEIIPDSLEAMRWDVMEWGFEMSLAKEVVVHIARALPAYLGRLASNAQELCEKALFAIHPGGPKILSHIQKILGLRTEQIAQSQAVLAACGNMSSATLPHIWKAMLEDDRVSGPIVSLAFGPGLTLSGCILEKPCG